MTFYKLLKNISDQANKKGILMKDLEFLKSKHLSEEELRNLRLSDYF